MLEGALLIYLASETAVVLFFIVTGREILASSILEDVLMEA